MGLPWGCGGLSVEDMIFGYARCSTVYQDVEVQRRQLVALGVDPDRIMVDLGYSAVAKHRPGLDKVLGMLREGDVVVVTKLDRLARSVVDAHEIAQCIDRSGAKLQIGSSVHDPFEYGNREAIEATMTVLGQRHGLDLETVFAEENADALIAAEMDCIAEVDNPQAAGERLKTVYSDAMGVDIDLDDLDGKVLDEEDDRVEVVDSSRSNNDVAEAASGDEFEVDNSLLEAIYGGQTFNEVRLDPARQWGDDSEQEGHEQRVSTAVERDAGFDR